MTKKIKTVEEYLDEIDYSFKGYVPSTDAIMFANFIREVNGGEEENKTPIVHMKIIEKIFSKRRRSAIMAHRGIAKSSLMEYLVLFVAAFGYIPHFGKTNLILYVSDSIENGVKNFRRNIQFRFENSEYLQKLIPNVKIKAKNSSSTFSGSDIDKAVSEGVKFTDIRLEFINFEGHRTIVKGYGCLTGLRGTKEQGIRPQVAIMDDLIQSVDVSRSPTQLQTIKDTIYSDVSKALHPKRSKIIYLGTPFNQNDPLYEAVESGAWDVSVYPIAERFDETTTRENFRGSWEDRFSYDYVKDEFDTAISTGQPQSFYRELMLRVIGDEDRMIRRDKIKWYTNQYDIVSNKNSYTFIITTDFATSEKESADYSCISVWAYRAGSYYWVDGYMKRATIDVTFDALFDFVQKYMPYSVGIERNATQKAFITMLLKEMQTRNIHFNLQRDKMRGEFGILNTKDKISRLNTVIPLFNMEKIKFPMNLKDSPILKELINELLSATPAGYRSKHDDMADTVAMLSSMNVIEPQEDQKQENIKVVDNIYEVDHFDDDKINSLSSYIV